MAIQLYCPIKQAYKEIITLHYRTNTQSINTLLGGNADILNIKSGGAYKSQFGLNM
jgi:hypothetical protein